ncbi:MAG: hypothetical protein PHU14_06405 [Methylovulum sp.]|nr:hypothetical protein [Methylovulum sp.]
MPAILRFADFSLCGAKFFNIITASWHDKFSVGNGRAKAVRFKVFAGIQGFTAINSITFKALLCAFLANLRFFSQQET